MARRENVGKIALDLMKKEPETRSPIEQMQEQLSEYDTNIFECVERCSKEFPGNFFIVVITKKEKLMPNVLRHFFFGRISCPTPDYDQTVYKYDRNDNCAQFLWTVPDKETCQLFMRDALLVHESERGLLEFVISFENGSLLKLCKALNNETEYTGQLILS